MLEQGNSVRSPPSEEEGDAEMMCYDLTTDPISAPLHSWWRGSTGERSLPVPISAHKPCVVFSLPCPDGQEI